MDPSRFAFLVSKEFFRKAFSLSQLLRSLRAYTYLSTFLVGGRSDYQFTETTEVAANMDVESGDIVDSKIGFGDLLHASNVGEPESIDELKYVSFLMYYLFCVPKVFNGCL